MFYKVLLSRIEGVKGDFKEKGVGEGLSLFGSWCWIEKTYWHIEDEKWACLILALV